MLAGLTSGDAAFALPSGVEVPVRQMVVFAPGSPNFNANIAIRQPVLPTPYTFWEVQLMVAPITVQNLSATPGTLVVNIYSSNAYVYQQEVTIPADSLFPVYFGSQALGVVSNTPGASGMPISVTMQAIGANMMAIMDTQGPATLRPNKPPYASVAGMAIQLLPMDTGPAALPANTSSTTASTSGTMQTALMLPGAAAALGPVIMSANTAPAGQAPVTTRTNGGFPLVFGGPAGPAPVPIAPTRTGDPLDDVWLAANLSEVLHDTDLWADF